ncbi:MAG TPA: glycosyltransferase family 9 protein [Holophagaceae bacterium]|nr:glycosyltransferase family 9 protein [Holophagaceae bacterium]
MDRDDGALLSLRKATALTPSGLEAHQRLIQACYDAARWDDYAAEVERFAAASPGSPLVEYERGYLNLLRGDLKTGWAQFEARLRVPGYVPPAKRFPQPRWTGGSFEGKTLLVHFEQGFGDTLMLVRYLPLVKARGGRVLLLVQPQFAYLMTTLQGPDQVVAFGHEELPPFDLQVSLFSLPAIFGTGLDSIPCDIPYLGIPRSVPNREALAALLAESEGQTRVGLAWGGNPVHPRDAQRSIPPALLDPLGAIPGVAWHSFQLGREDRPSLPGLVSLAPLLQTFSDSAYALSGMDLVITVDTALAHLAGALGIPTLLLVSHAPDFRWRLDREDSPWYPSMRIYRQPRCGEWAPVIQQLLSDLAG